MKQYLLLLIIFLTLSSNAFAQSKMALVIGNADYKSAALRNSVNDAKDIAEVLKELGFDVTLKTNINHIEFENTIRDFTQKIQSGGITLFFYSGHGMQVNGLNYLIPVGENIYTENEIKYKSVATGFLLDKLQKSGSAVNIILLDACRDNPFSGFRSLSKGFVPVIAPSGTIISYSTAPGTMAFDGDEKNSPYTESLLLNIKKEGFQIEDVFKEVRKSVIQKTSKRQTPWESSSLLEKFYFNKGTITQPIIVSKKKEVVDRKQAGSFNKTPHENFSGNSGTFTDKRDRQSYKWVQIGTQIWMAENLKYETSNSWCYDNDKANCDKYGRLYNWDAAMKSCPEGWHLPSDDEWDILVNYIGGAKVAGKKLKSTYDWYLNKNGSNAYGFEVLPGGCRYSNVSFDLLEHYAYFWSSHEIGAGAWPRSFYYSYDEVYHYFNYKSYGFSVRCVQD